MNNQHYYLTVTLSDCVIVVMEHMVKVKKFMVGDDRNKGLV